MQIEVVLEPPACLLGFLEKEGEGSLERATGWLVGWGEGAGGLVAIDVKQ